LAIVAGTVFAVPAITCLEQGAFAAGGGGKSKGPKGEGGKK
jgi:hypothetical protein